MNSANTSPDTTVRRRAPILATAALTLAAAAGAYTLHASRAEARAPGPAAAAERFEYGILVVLTNDAVFWTAAEPFLLEAAEPRVPEQLIGSQRIRVIRPAEVEHLNTLGAAGWDVVQTAAGGDGRSYLLRRRL